MASQFQHRLVGTVIVIALGVIILPNVLDGKKKYYQDQFAAIPLVPKADDRPPMNMLPPVTQALPEVNVASTEPVADSSAVTSNEPAADGTTTGNTTIGSTTAGAVVTAPSTTVSSAATSTSSISSTTSATQPPVRTSAETTATSQTARDKPPVGEAYVIQLAALSNAARVNELVAQLTLANYRVYTLPTTPIQGKVTRIFIGPEISKQKLEASLPELKKLTGLDGMVRNYSAIR